MILYEFRNFFFLLTGNKLKRIKYKTSNKWPLARKWSIEVPKYTGGMVLYFAPSINPSNPTITIIFFYFLLFFSSKTIEHYQRIAFQLKYLCIKIIIKFLNKNKTKKNKSTAAYTKIGSRTNDDYKHSVFRFIAVALAGF